MNKVLRGSLIQRPEVIPQPTVAPRKERMWHAEHFGEVTKAEAKQAAKETGEAVNKAASSEEAKVAGEVAKGTGKELTFSSVPEGEIKDLVRENAVDIYKTFSIEYPETVANPELLFKYRTPANAVNSLVDAAGFSLFSATRGDTTTIQKFILDALKDALPQLEDRQIYASL